MSETKEKDQDGQEATPEVVEKQELETPEAPDTSKMSVEELRSLAESALESKRSANAEAKGYRLKLEKIDSDKTKATEEELKEQKKFETLYNTEKETSEGLRGKIKKIDIKSSLVKEALKQGIIDEDLVDHMVDKVPDDFDSKKDSKKFVSDWKKDKPKLFPTVDNSSPTTNSGGPQPTNTKLKPKNLVEEQREYLSVPFEDRNTGRVDDN